MPQLGARSRSRLVHVAPPLVVLLERAIVHTDFTVLTGRRGKVAQMEAYNGKRSKKRWPDSAHNCPIPDPSKPRHLWEEDPDGLSNAVDVAPWPIDWGNEGSAQRRAAAIQRFAFMNGVIRAIAGEMGIQLIQGHDWDGDGVINSIDPDSGGFMDWPHQELRTYPVPWR